MAYKLSTSMPFLLARLGIRMGTLFSKRLAVYDLTLPMYRVLAALSETPGQKLGDLSTTTTVELSTMSRLISTMVKRGLVSRHRPPDNERSVQIGLTERGAQLADLVRIEAEHYEEVAVSTLDSADIERFRSTLSRMFDALDVLEDELVTNAPKRAGDL